ncbi:tRNA(Ile)-lysidine synthase [Senna tora]|uniref:tRNA(Ile)-lysidine synthetase n=1 Tax=Senna tora TaxID=362788 RepID=A0A834TEU8_9FABA|nr:tRNA(Ile)-lysidine synthase [Senna tora]
MARGLLLSSQSRTDTANILLASFSKIPRKPCNASLAFPMYHHYHHQPRSSSAQHPIDMSKYREAFSRRMAMAGLKPHHRIALGVSGGPDSVALCVLTAWWKTAGLNADNGGLIDGLLAIIVDHGLRAESKHEANVVHHRVSEMGIRCEIAHCDWPNGRPKLGHLQEAAREMRYETFHKICAQHQIGVLLIAHHADDQAELFILRMSRNSGVLGLAGMPFTSQIFSTHTHSSNTVPLNYGILLVRPLLEFSKEDMYKVCQGGSKDWVEDPTNQSPLFARNRIRMSLTDLSSSAFKSELQAVISACRMTRLYIDQVCYSLINQAVIIMDHGYASIDIKILNPSNIVDICLCKFISLVLQFISQRQRPIRGRALKLLLDYIRTFPCKNSLTAAGCYLCPDPGSRGSRILVCCSVNCPLPLKMEVFQSRSDQEQECSVFYELEEIIEDGKYHARQLVPNASNVHFLDVTPEFVLTEAKRLNIISESTYRNIIVLQKEETNRFKSKAEVTTNSNKKHEVDFVTTFGKLFELGNICYFMNRFIITWELNDKITGGAFSDFFTYSKDLGGESQNYCCVSCVVGHNTRPEVRNMCESDWLYLAELSKHPPSDDFQLQGTTSSSEMGQMMEKRTPCLHYASVSAQKALLLLKSIPVAARRSMPVLVNQKGQLLSIPTVNFSHCPCLMVHAEFKPKIPLGGGHSSFI